MPPRVPHPNGAATSPTSPLPPRPPANDRFPPAPAAGRSRPSPPVPGRQEERSTTGELTTASRAAMAPSSTPSKPAPAPPTQSPPSAQPAAGPTDPSLAAALTANLPTPERIEAAERARRERIKRSRIATGAAPFDST
jgi:hypothetical protein